jgi:tetratricopeptide (TPR) repeat protein
MSDLDTLSGIDFEKLIAQLLERMGFRVEMTKASGDGGIDIVATLDHAVTGGRFLVQCKRYAPGSLVGAATVREFYGALTADQLARKGILITTSGFTGQALQFSRRLPIELIGRDRLLQLLEQHGLRSGAFGVDATAEPMTPQPKDRATELWDLAMKQMEPGKCAQAIPLLKELAQLRPNDPSVWLNLGIAYCFCCLYDDQVEVLREAVRLKPDLFEAWLWLGRGLTHSGELAAAANAFTQALTIQPDDFNALYWLANMFERKDDRETAVAIYEKATKIKPDDKRGWWRLGANLNHLGKNSEALAASREALRIDPNFPCAWQTLCYVYHALGDRARMSQALSRLEQLDASMARQLNFLRRSRAS